MHGLIVKADDVDPDVASIIDDPCVWYALHVERNAIRRACIWMRIRQMKPYWPRYRGTVRLNRHRKTTAWRSVLPGYLFLPIPLSGQANWRLIEQTPGVKRVMRRGNGNLVILSDHDMSEIKRIELALQESAVAAEQGIPFRVGDRVWLKSHAWKFEHSIKITRIDDKRHIWLEVDGLFGRTTKMVVPASEIEIA